jgi:hypothetical protein
MNRQFPRAEPVCGNKPLGDRSCRRVERLIGSAIANTLHNEAFNYKFEAGIQQP